MIPDCVTGLPHLTDLIIQNCRKLVSLHGLPPSLLKLDAADCGSLRSRLVLFNNCLSLDEEVGRVIIQLWDYKYVFLPGKQVPAGFTHKATGKSITISQGTFSLSSRFKACLLLSPNIMVQFGYDVICRLRSKGVVINELVLSEESRPFQLYPQLLTEHMLVFSGALFKEHKCVEVDTTKSEILFEFMCDENIIECGVQILAEESESSSSKWTEESDGAVEFSKDESVVKSSKNTGWLSKLGLKKDK
ncbi:unnamed protein product [Microthlaspi erraticum]|uniref:C-JID domain-containing protein n=1 Tax=Microthlaspi erraticum TaxID=1685480 RepID=A0A6D2I2D7_9BRAS|nr:unnamed protein product [Microthlaspi erraticum]